MMTRQIKSLTFLVATACLALAGCLESSSSESVATPPTAPPANAAPTISGNPPAAVMVGETYTFTPSASDADGDSLTFSIENKPSWANFDSANGRLSGNPTLADIGTFTNIRVSVSDGSASASLPGFSIDVTQIGTVSTTLSWTAPTLNEDGTPLDNLAGYKIYYGTASRSYTNTIQIDSPAITTYVVENLTPGTYYFAATAFNADGIESRFSGEASATLN